MLHFKGWHLILDILFPTKCLGCKIYTHQSLLCQSCINSLNIYHYFVCPQCQKRIDFVNLNFCNHQSNLNALLSCTDYSNNVTRELVHKFKYERFLSLTNIFDTIICQSLNHYQNYFKNNNYLIIPVPLH